jgi:hypothetical protein
VLDIEQDFHDEKISVTEAKEKISALQKRLKVGLSVPGKKTSYDDEYQGTQSVFV